MKKSLHIMQIYEKMVLAITIVYLLLLSIGFLNSNKNSYTLLKEVVIVILFCRYGVFDVLSLQHKLRIVPHEKLMGFIKVAFVGLTIPAAISILTLQLEMALEIALIYSGICLFLKKYD